MSDTPVLKAKCDTDFGIAKGENGELIIHMKISGMPEVLVDHLLTQTEKLPMPIISALMQVLGAEPLEKGAVGKLLAMGSKQAVH